MFTQIHKLTPEMREFALSFNMSDKGKSDVVSFVLANILVNKVDLSEDGPSLLASSCRCYNVINELIKIDIYKIDGYSKKLTEYRMWNISNKAPPLSIRNGTQAVYDMFGISRFFSSEDILMFENKALEISTLMVKFNTLTSELGVFNDHGK